MSGRKEATAGSQVTHVGCGKAARRSERARMVFEGIAGYAAGRPLIDPVISFELRLPLAAAALPRHPRRHDRDLSAAGRDRQGVLLPPATGAPPPLRSLGHPAVRGKVDS